MTWLIVWLVLLVILIIIEFMSLAMTTIWIAIGAMVSAVLAALDVPVWIQIIAFGVVSFLLIAFVRPGAKRRFDQFHKKDKANKLIGKRGSVISEIDNLRGIGQIRVMGQEWAAISEEENVVIPIGAIVDVTGVYGNKLIICLDESMDGNIDLAMSDAMLDPNFIEDNRNW